MIDMPASPGAPCRYRRERKRGEKLREKYKDNYIPIKTGVIQGCLRCETFRAYRAAAVPASPSSCPALWKKRCHLELLRCARKWKLHSKENYKHIKHFLAKLRFSSIASVKDGLKPLLFIFCKSRRTVSRRRKKRRDVLGFTEMGAARTSLAACRNASLVCFSNSVGM